MWEQEDRPFDAERDAEEFLIAEAEKKLKATFGDVTEVSEDDWLATYVEFPGLVRGP